MFLNKLFEFKLINNLHIFQSNEKLKNKGFNNSSAMFLKKLKLKNLMLVNLHNDMLYKIKVK